MGETRKLRTVYHPLDFRSEQDGGCPILKLPVKRRQALLESNLIEE